MTIDELYKIFKQYPSVQTDTRKIKSGELFFALKGPNFNGNDYAQIALNAGAAYCIVDEDTGFADQRLIKVDDCLQTLQQLAKKHREFFDIPFIAITGSNGKTTTKELLHAVLSSAYITYTTEGNLNNQIGIPLTILKVKKDAQFAVIEMGANHQQEIKSYCDYALPSHGLITNCGKAHLEGFGGEAGVKKGKGELFDYLRTTGGTAFVFQDYDYLLEMSSGISNIIRYGTETKAVDCAGAAFIEHGFLSVSINKGAAIPVIQTQLVGEYNFANVLAAVCIGKTFGVADEKIKTSLETYTPSNSRSQLLHKDSNTIILDAYNANPSSMKVAIENFAKMPGENKILMLGAMMELGEASVVEHQEVVSLINQFQWKNVILVGDNFEIAAGNHSYFKNVNDVKFWFNANNITNASILIKGSRSMQMEKVLE